jgi:hydantoinase/carbamoylase family amidase
MLDGQRRKLNAVTELIRDLQTLSRFGADGDDGGISRLAWSPPLLEASGWLVQQVRALGLDADLDAAGNVVAVWAADGGDALVVGSHLDTVPNGGRFDGALGVIAGLAALRQLRGSGFQPKRPIWLVSFMDEEGARFSTPMFGSRAFVGEDLQHLGTRTDGDGTRLADAMSAAGFSLEALSSARAIDRVHGYLELHIEQGPVLEAQDTDVGVVTHIAGSADLQVVVTGEAGHAGTTPMGARRDALVGASRMITLICQAAAEDGDVRATVGTIAVSPGASNVIPARAEFTVDVRATEDAAIDRFSARLSALIADIAREEGLEASLDEAARLAPLALDGDLQGALVAAAREAGASFTSMPSGAAHDAMVIGRHVPAGMLFVPSRGGISHNPAEYTSADDAVRGAEVLTRAIAQLAS